MVGVDLNSRSQIGMSDFLRRAARGLKRAEPPHEYGAELRKRIEGKRGSGLEIGEALKGLSGGECGILTGELMKYGKLSPAEIVQFVKSTAAALKEKDQTAFYLGAMRALLPALMIKREDGQLTVCLTKIEPHLSGINQYLNEIISWLNLADRDSMDFCVTAMVELLRVVDSYLEQGKIHLAWMRDVSGFPSEGEKELQDPLSRMLRAAEKLDREERHFPYITPTSSREGPSNLAKGDKGLSIKTFRFLVVFDEGVQTGDKEAERRQARIEITKNEDINKIRMVLIKDFVEAANELARLRWPDEIERGKFLKKLFMGKELKSLKNYPEYAHEIQTFLWRWFRHEVSVPVRSSTLTPPDGTTAIISSVKARKIPRVGSYGTETRNLSSEIYGQLGTFRQLEWSDLWQSESGRVYLLGNGGVGGKGEGAIFLDRTSEELGFMVPRTLIVCEDFFRIHPQPVENPALLGDLAPQSVSDIIKLLQKLGFSQFLAFRSSAPIEDQIGQTAAGVFSTRFNAKPGDDSASFGRNLLEVYNSTYSDVAAAYYQRRGNLKIPPLSVIIQELVGNDWTYPPSSFFPALAGIVNTASPNKTRVVTVRGFGLTAVSIAGLGITHTFNHDLGLIGKEGVLPQIYYVDKSEGGMASADALPPYSGRDPQSFIERDLAKLGLSIQKRIGHPVDVEWALGEDSRPYLLQVRPVKPKAGIVPKPKTSAENILLNTNDVIGRGSKTFNHAIIADLNFEARLPEQDIKELFSSYPDALFIYIADVNSRFTPQDLRKLILLYGAQAVIVIDRGGEFHKFGSGLQHIALNAADEDTLLLYFAGNTIPDNLVKNLGRRVREISFGSTGEDGLEVYKLFQPLYVAADDEYKWGMVYR
ncbi:hypothetical protein A3F86_03120 [candidate division WOR-1 bacterium RIFCSPLOWO2_12_FULL_45_9]|uniref:Pyruvate phosphate dikinase AMP/ATP-binding domain-containing protein n=1 Tax=candidate division WOR-1 bacterium RIFCSPLOWO2_12_FULL_45_9 TaxID=1802568 RepID=A0A1F4RI40_UNCSA|nr:MAG: hypothetical protein A3F86_03120 [candidate division WOR-1 bacterium RIFCSPLOWO2_12_FULL_45_9]